MPSVLNRLGPLKCFQESGVLTIIKFYKANFLGGHPCSYQPDQTWPWQSGPGADNKFRKPTNYHPTKILVDTSIWAWPWSRQTWFQSFLILIQLKIFVWSIVIINEFLTWTLEVLLLVFLVMQIINVSCIFWMCFILTLSQVFDIYIRLKLTLGWFSALTITNILPGYVSSFTIYSQFWKLNVTPVNLTPASWQTPL